MFVVSKMLIKDRFEAEKSIAPFVYSALGFVASAGAFFPSVYSLLIFKSHTISTFFSYSQRTFDLIGYLCVLIGFLDLA